MKRFYPILFLVAMLVYILALVYNALIVVDNRLTFETAHISYITTRGGNGAHNMYYLADKNYDLKRLKVNIGSYISRKELSMLRDDEGNVKKGMQISYYIDNKAGRKRANYIPIGLTSGSRSVKSGFWYYCTLFRYSTGSVYMLVLLVPFAVLFVTCNNKKYRKHGWILSISNSLFAILVIFFVFL